MVKTNITLSISLNDKIFITKTISTSNVNKYNAPHFYSITTAWLPVSEHIKFKIVLLTRLYTNSPPPTFKIS